MEELAGVIIRVVITLTVIIVIPMVMFQAAMELLIT